MLTGEAADQMLKMEVGHNNFAQLSRKIAAGLVCATEMVAPTASMLGGVAARPSAAVASVPRRAAARLRVTQMLRVARARRVGSGRPQAISSSHRAWADRR